MQDTFKIWSITNYDEYLNQWPAIPGKFDKLTDYQKSLGYKDPKDFFDKQVFAAQTLANDRVGGILEKVFKTEDLTDGVKEQLKKFSYQAIDFLRMNDSVINFDIRTNQITFNNNRQFTSGTNIERIEQLCGPMAWRSWTLANIERLYESWADCNNIPYLLDEAKFYTKKEVDTKLGGIDDQIQTQQRLVDQKLKEFNWYMDKYLLEFTQKLPKDKEFVNNVTKEAAKNPNLKGDKGDKGDPGSVSNVPNPVNPIDATNKEYVDKQDQEVKNYIDFKFKSNASSPTGLDYIPAGNLNMKSKAIVELGEPIADSHATTKKYVDNSSAIVQGNVDALWKPTEYGVLYKSQGFLSLENKLIKNISTPTDENDAANKKYVDNATINLPTAKAVQDNLDNLWKKNAEGTITEYKGKSVLLIKTHIFGLPNSVVDISQAVNKYYVDSKIKFMFESLMPSYSNKIKQLMKIFDKEVLPNLIKNRDEKNHEK